MRLLNIHNNGRTIYLFLRDEKGKQEIKEVTSFFPYFFQKHPEGECKSYLGEPLKKMFVSVPRDVPKQRQNDSYEADILFTKRYIIDKVDKIEKTTIKYAFVDIEVEAEEMPDANEAKYPINSIAVFNSMDGSVKNFNLFDYNSEYEMLEAFCTYIKKEAFDILMAWNMEGFDYPYLYNRIENFAEKISPIGQSRYGRENIMHPAGIAIIDYMNWDKKVTLNRRFSYALDNVSIDELKIEPRKKIKFGKLTKEVLNKNIEDVKLMAQIEEKKQYIPYFDEIRRLAKVEWEDLLWNSRVIDMLLLAEAKNQKVVLPMKPAESRGTLEEKEDFAGAYREVFKTGSHWGVGKYDLTSAYPYAIVDFCLDPTNIWEGHIPGNKPINTEKLIEIQETAFMQNPEALLPTVVKRLMILKDKIKKELKQFNPDTKEYKDKKVYYDAIKTIVNSSFGVMGNRFFRLYCYSEDTEILTENGWKRWFDIEKGTNVATYNIKLDNIEFQPVLNKNVQKVENQEMYNFKNKRTNQLITPYHKVLFLDEKNQKYISFAKDAKIFHRKFPLVRELKNNRQDYPISDSLLKLYAWIITEGNDTYKSQKKGFKNKLHISRWRIVQSLKANKQYCNDIDIIFKNLKWKISTRIQGFLKIWDISVKYSKEIQLEDNYKVIPLWMLQKLSLRQLKLLYLELMKGDGAKTKYYYSAKDNVARNRFQYLCTLIGISTIKRKDKILLNTSQNVTISTSRYKKQKINYSGIVWCPTVTNGFVVMRREGKVFISGNSNRVASAITFIVRSLLKYVKEGIEKKGYKVIYVDTDSIFLDTKEDLKEELNNLINEWSLNIFGKKEINIKFEHEGYYEKLLLLTKCRYIGYLKTDKGIEEEIKGVEAKRKDSTIYMKKFQRTLIDKILDKEPKDRIISWIKSKIANFKNLPLQDIAFPCKLARKIEDYKNLPIFARAIQETPEFNPRLGENFYYIYVDPEYYYDEKPVKNLYEIVPGKRKGTTKKLKLSKKKEEERIDYWGESFEELLEKGIFIEEHKIQKIKKARDVKAFNEDTIDTIKNIDWKRMLERNIYNKIEVIFEAMGWDISEIRSKNTSNLCVGKPLAKEKKVNKGMYSPKIKENPIKSTKVIENKEDKEINPYYEE